MPSDQRQRTDGYGALLAGPGRHSTTARGSRGASWRVRRKLFASSTPVSRRLATGVIGRSSGPGCDRPADEDVSRPVTEGDQRDDAEPENVAERGSHQSVDPAGCLVGIGTAVEQPDEPQGVGNGEGDTPPEGTGTRTRASRLGSARPRPLRRARGRRSCTPPRPSGKNWSRSALVAVASRRSSRTAPGSGPSARLWPSRVALSSQRSHWAGVDSLTGPNGVTRVVRIPTDPSVERSTAFVTGSR